MEHLLDSRSARRGKPGSEVATTVTHIAGWRTMAAPRIVVLGSSNTDLVIRAPRLPAPGETLLGGEFARLPGGKGANQAVAAARAGARVAFIGARGDDDFGRAARTALHAEGIDVAAFRVRPDLPSGVALIMVGDRDRQNQIMVARSANDAVAPADIDRERDRLARADIIVAQLETPLVAVRRAAKIAAECDVPFLLNPAPARALPKTLLRLVHTLIPNEYEATLLTGRNTPRAAAEELLRRGCLRVIVTLGARGALVADADGIEIIPSPRVRVKDTVGAGDCFTGWLAVGLAEGLALREAVTQAIDAAAIQVTRIGAQAAMPRRNEVRQSSQKEKAGARII